MSIFEDNFSPQFQKIKPKLGVSIIQKILGQKKSEEPVEELAQILSGKVSKQKYQEFVNFNGHHSYVF